MFARRALGAGSSSSPCAASSAHGSIVGTSSEMPVRTTRGRGSHVIAGSRALAEREDVETVGSADQGVRLFADAVDDAVARADLEGFAVLPRETGPVEHEEDLLLRDLDVHRRRLFARTHPRSGHADVACSGRLAEVVAVELDRALVLVARLEVVPVNDHVLAGFRLSKREITTASSHGTSPL